MLSLLLGHDLKHDTAPASVTRILLLLLDRRLLFFFHGWPVRLPLQIFVSCLFGLASLLLLFGFVLASISDSLTLRLSKIYAFRLHSHLRPSSYLTLIFLKRRLLYCQLRLVGASATTLLPGICKLTVSLRSSALDPSISFVLLLLGLHHGSSPASVNFRRRHFFFLLLHDSPHLVLLHDSPHLAHLGLLSSLLVSALASSTALNVFVLASITFSVATGASALTSRVVFAFFFGLHLFV